MICRGDSGGVLPAPREGRGGEGWRGCDHTVLQPHALRGHAGRADSGETGL